VKPSTSGEPLYLAREFAQRAGVTVRTLHHYDRLGLLRPRARTAAGYRLYGLGELTRLEQIVALKFLGFPLRQIRELLKADRRDLVVSLRQQRQIMEERRQRLDCAVRAIAAAEASAAAGHAPDWDAFRNIIEVIHMQQDNTWTEKYFTPEQLALVRSGEPWTPERQEQISRQWKELGQELNQAAEADLDSASPEAGALIDRHAALVAQFTKGDPSVVESLRKMWADRANWPQNHNMQLPYSEQAIAWISRAYASRKRARA
jgi:DNA-binding transcriptional MerR regulator